MFLDPNTLSDEGTVALSAVAFSKDGKYMAYSVASAGSDWVEIHVIDTESGEQLADKIEWVKFSGASWAPDGKGFYYSAYDKPEKGVFSSQNQFQKVYYHKLGDVQSADELIYWDAQHPLRYFSGEESGDGKWQFIHASEVRRVARCSIARRASARSAPCSQALLTTTRSLPSRATMHTC